MINGIILIDKPQGFTSFDVIAKMRGILGQKKLGHSGTLDPMATGVLPVFAGSATKAVSIIPKTGKRYSAGFRLGMTTDSFDITGNITSEISFCVSREELLSALDKFRGVIRQKPPVYSAVKVGGKRLYDIARKGKASDVEIPEREVTVSELSLTDFDERSGTGVLDIACSQGTYVRSIISDMGKALGCGAVMTSLVRTLSNGFELESCITLGDLQMLRDENRLSECVIPVERLFMSLPEIRLDEKQSFLYKNGVKQELCRFGDLPGDSELFRVYSYEGVFLGIARADREENVLRVCKNLGGDEK